MSLLNILGHNDFQYRVRTGWGSLNPSVHPVNDCHEMVRDRNGFLYLLTNETQNNVIVYNKGGRYVKSWGTTYPGAHGLTYSEENGEEFLFVTDTIRHQVIKTTLSGKEIMVLGYPSMVAEYSSEDLYKPTETAIAPNGDIYVTDGYGCQFIIQYDHNGNYIRHFGGKGDRPDQFDCCHGITIDNRMGNPNLLITSRNHNAFKQFDMEGNYLGVITIPGSFVCRPVVNGQNLYAAVFRSGDNQNFGSGYITILDNDNKVVSSPGASTPIYIEGKLLEQIKIASPFIHPHDVCIDADENLIIPQWNSGKSYPIFLEKI